MYYILYIDRLFFLNLGMNLFALSLTNVSFGNRASHFRVILSAGIGAAGCIGVLFLPALPYLVKTVIGFVGISAAMVWLLYPKGNLHFFVKALTSLYGFSFLLGGTLLFLKRFVKPDGNHVFLTVLLPAAVIYLLLRFFLKRRKEIQNECEVFLYAGEKEVRLKAFVDSGNMLTEPVSGKPVSVMEKAVLEKAGIQLPEEKCRVIPYHSVGKQNGILMGYEFSKMVIRRPSADNETEKVMVAVSEDTLFASGRYQMLLHPKLLESEPVRKKGRLADKKDLEEFT